MVQKELYEKGETFVSKGGNQFKLEPNLYQSGAVASKWGKMLFQSVAVISKWGNYFKVGHNITILTFEDTLIETYHKFVTKFL